MKGIVGGKSLILKIYTTNLGAMMGFSLFLQNMASSVLSTKKGRLKIYKKYLEPIKTNDDMLRYLKHFLKKNLPNLTSSM